MKESLAFVHAFFLVSGKGACRPGEGPTDSPIIPMTLEEKIMKLRKAVEGAGEDIQRASE